MDIAKVLFLFFVGVPVVIFAAYKSFGKTSGHHQVPDDYIKRGK